MRSCLAVCQVLFQTEIRCEEQSPRGRIIYLYNELLKYPLVTKYLSDMVFSKKIKNLSLLFLVEDQFSIVSGAQSSVIELGFVTELKADLKESSP